MRHIDMTENATSKYNKAARHLHWWMALLIVIAYVLINLRTQFPRGSAGRALMLALHFWFGIAVLILAFPRLANRYRNAPPGIEPPLSRVMRALALVTHYLIYAFIFVQPILGILTYMIGHGNLPIPFTHASIPWPFGVSRDMGHALEDVHKTIGVAFYYVFGLHIAAALYHHVIRRDNALRRIV
jgi:cytochrome b561